MRKIVLAIIFLLTIVLNGCSSTSTESTSSEVGFVMYTESIENGDSDYYSKIAILNNIENKPDLLKYKEEWAIKYGNVKPALAWKLDRNEINEEDKLHVEVIYMEGESGTAEEIWPSIVMKVKELNELNGCQIDTSKWTLASMGYYCVLTKAELLLLTNNGFMGGYVGSGEGDYKKMDINTPVGVDIYVELYGDYIVQYIDGKEIKDYTK